MRVAYGPFTYAVFFRYQPAQFLVKEVRKDIREVFRLLNLVVDEDEMLEYEADAVDYENAPQDIVCNIEELTLDESGKIVHSEVVAREIAEVSKHDQYDKLVGRKLAFQRAVDLVTDRDLRATLWNAFLSQHYIRTHNGDKRILKK